MSPARYLLTVLALFAALGMAAAAYAWSEAGRFTRSGYASCAYIQKKIELAKNVTSPKLVVVAGSNAADGINAGAIVKALPGHAFNFALVATFSPGFQLFQAKKVLKPGDAVLLASEYLAYEYQVPTNTMVDTVYSCGVDYWRSLDWPHRLFFVLALRPQRFFSTLAFDPAVSANVNETIAGTITADGDLDERANEPASNAGAHRPLLIRFLPQSNGVREIADFIHWAKENRITVFATWPNTLYFSEYDRNPVFEDIANFYRALGVEIVGKPQDAMVTKEFLADTIYHLTASGIAMRTSKLIENLKSDGAFTAWIKREHPTDG
jgi:hypothetical protein